MPNAVSPENFGVPEKIQKAERWRRAGEAMHRLSPEVFEQVYAFLVLSTIGISDDNDDKITESYFLT